MGYSAYVLMEESRQKLLERFPPSFPQVIAHHITYRFPDKKPPPHLEKAVVIGHCKGENIECLVVTLGGTHQRPKGGVFHITLSLDRSAGAKPVHSNKILKKGWISISQPIDIQIIPQLISING